jgi:hypothetical protein
MCSVSSVSASLYVTIYFFEKGSEYAMADPALRIDWSYGLFVPTVTPL